VAGLRIERLELARAAVHEQKDARHLAAAQLLSVRGQRFHQAQSGGAGGHGTQEGAPADDAVAIRLHLHVGLQGHVLFPSTPAADRLRD
jgi:hypothetical protein